MNITVGSVVISRAGHDCGRAMLVVRTDDEFLFVADGKERKLDKPKKKNKKHVRATSRVINPAGLTDRSLRRTLRELFEQDSALQESE
ncbi:MAG: hypothetical protein ACI4JZ_09810 [Oscillospiraceae bacterium]